MNEPREQQRAANDDVMYERCACREVLDQLQKWFGVSPVVRQHLKNSRIEFLKAVRSVIDERIEHLSEAGQQGTKVTVE